ncbi:Ldh family oxidoreductase [Geminicoccus flavidas]|uniref:Ldh family oxidoreductase n=1 Tax=Geminicoccus flavidas TaxID=2506407 RepID=UPI001357D391|nr:Ldh family oxidoreductase [Geminicoccus flavidas]
MTGDRYEVGALVAFAAALFEKVGLDEDKAAVTARLLVDADLMGHTTHGLNLAGPYLAEAQKGSMATTGQPEEVARKAAALTLDGRRLPGVWLTARAVDEAIAMAKAAGIGAVSIRRSHHIACLATFLPRATEQGLYIQIACSDPNVASVAPFGGTRAVFTPDPYAIGIPTSGDPILIDTSASITTNGMSNRLLAEGRTFDHPWLLTAEGEPSNDPKVFNTDPPGTILPTGGLDHGHKGYGLALNIEALSQGLSGFGRADPGEGWGASVWVQVVDPEAFAGLPAFRRQVDHIVAACRACPPRPGVEAVRLPGQAAMAKKRQAMAEGAVLHHAIMPALLPWADRLGVKAPEPIAR